MSSAQIEIRIWLWRWKWRRKKQQQEHLIDMPLNCLFSFFLFYVFLGCEIVSRIFGNWESKCLVLTANKQKSKSKTHSNSSNETTRKCATLM